MLKQVFVYDVHFLQILEKFGDIDISTFIDEIYSLVCELRILDSGFRVFGSKPGNHWGHGYKFNNPLTLSDVLKFESKTGVNLPEDYRDFILNLGDGGVGPYYGIKKLADAAEYSDLSKSFPWVSKVNLSNDDYDDMLPGALVIAERGCAYTDILVVKGLSCGQIWSDFTAADEPILPSHDSFSDWYLDWLKRCIATIKREPLIDQIKVGMSVEELSAILGDDMDRWSSTSNLPDSPAYYIGFSNTNASFSIDSNHTVKEINKMNFV